MLERQKGNRSLAHLPIEFCGFGFPHNGFYFLQTEKTEVRAENSAVVGLLTVEEGMCSENQIKLELAHFFEIEWVWRLFKLKAKVEETERIMDGFGVLSQVWVKVLGVPSVARNVVDMNKLAVLAVLSPFTPDGGAIYVHEDEGKSKQKMDDSKKGGHQMNTIDDSSQSEQGKEDARDSTSGGQRKHVEETDSMMGGKVDILDFLEDISEEEVEEVMGNGGVEMKQDFKGVADDTFMLSGKVDTTSELESVVINSKLRGSKGDAKDDVVGDVGEERAIEVFDSDNFDK
ncbi:hypothetical protein GUJ93_ZPchr0006g43328 [Zizania palustris]|uniref:DUF4283 domain-containing protein n=1 Tax=Zizania palustris TaxID=103762 RepID=A0A8J5W4W5_ZIZPA|nr:hypothetical protein GUJ93_ZPchr0006g43328 [Zizania palustris]